MAHHWRDRVLLEILVILWVSSDGFSPRSAVCCWSGLHQNNPPPVKTYRNGWGFLSNDLLRGTPGYLHLRATQYQFPVRCGDWFLPVGIPAAIAFPANSGGLFEAFGNHFHFAAYHEGWVKARPNLPMMAVSFWPLYFCCTNSSARQSYLVDVFLHFIGCLPTRYRRWWWCRILYPASLSFNSPSSPFASPMEERFWVFAWHPPHYPTSSWENLMVAVQELFDNRENVFCLNTNTSVLHNINCLAGKCQKNTDPYL